MRRGVEEWVLLQTHMVKACSSEESHSSGCSCGTMERDIPAARLWRRGAATSGNKENGAQLMQLKLLPEGFAGSLAQPRRISFPFVWREWGMARRSRLQTIITKAGVQTRIGDLLWGHGWWLLSAIACILACRHALHHTCSCQGGWGWR